jgi:hypothetical protein
LRHHKNREAYFRVACLLAGSVAATLVYVGDHFQWPNFCGRSGYFGTDYLASWLYAINDPFAIHIVAFIWFAYVAGALFSFGWLVRLYNRDIDEHTARAAETHETSATTIKKCMEAEQVGADQPATAPESKPEGGKKPKPESEERPQ